jgi:hypothetical protein
VSNEPTKKKRGAAWFRCASWLEDVECLKCGLESCFALPLDPQGPSCPSIGKISNVFQSKGLITALQKVD